jgi:hypothetical protein
MTMSFVLDGFNLEKWHYEKKKYIMTLLKDKSW